MEFRATRRKILAASGSVAGAVLAGVGGVFPESQLGSSGRPGDLSGISLRDLVIDELGSSEVEALVQRSRKAKGGEALWRRVSELGLQPDTSLARGMSAHFRQAPAKVGTGLTLMLRRDGMLAGRVAFGSDVEGKLRGGIAVVDPSSGAVDVHQLDGSAVNYRSRVTFANGEAIVDYADGRRKAVPLPKRQRPPGLAALAASPCNVDCLSCNLICGTTCAFACGYEAFVVCTGADLLCPPCGLICTVFFLLVCGLVCSFGCYEVCAACC